MNFCYTFHHKNIVILKLKYFTGLEPCLPFTKNQTLKKKSVLSKIIVDFLKFWRDWSCLLFYQKDKYLMSSASPVFVSQIKTKLWKKKQPYLHKNPLNFWNSDMFELVFFAIITLQIIVSLLFSSVTVTFVMTKTLLKHCKSQTKNRHC